MNDGTIGNIGSGATTRANVDTFPLYNLLYTNVDPSVGLCPGRTGNVVTDFTNNVLLTLPAALGRALCSAGSGSGLTARLLGSNFGTETVSLTANQNGSHAHQFIGGGDFLSFIGSGGFGNIGTGNSFGDAGSTDFSGSGAPHNNMQPSSFMNFFIKL